jgi:alkaline phosphatase D
VSDGRARARARRRRRWLGRLSVALLFLGAAPSGIGPAAPVAVEEESGLLVTVAEVGADRAVLWLRAAGSEPLGVRVAPADDPGAARAFQAVASADWDHIVRVPLRGLRPGTRYAYQVTAGREQAAGTFTSAPDPGADTRVHLLWSGDLGGGGYCRDPEDGYSIFRAMAQRRADFFLFVGDTAYADHVCGVPRHAAGADFVARTVEEYRAKHRYNRADPTFQAFLRTTPVYAIWDDHEVRNNFVGPGEPLMPAGRRAFRDYWGLVGDAEEPDRLYRSVRWGRHVEVFILDTRQYRSPNATPDGPAKTMLGLAQRRWLLDGVTASTATWKVIVSTVPLGMFTGGAHSDSWSSANILGYPRPGNGFAWERDLILGTLREEGVRNVAFLTGEVHHAELIRHDLATGYHVHEFVAGPLAARRGFPRFLDRSLGSRSLGRLGLAANFGEVVADGRALTVRIRDRSGSARTTLQLTAETLRGDAS